MTTQEQKDKFFEGLALTNNVTKASQLAGIGRATGYRLRQENPEEYEQAHQEYLDSLESMFHEAVMNGLWEDVVFQGVKTGEKKFRQSAPMMIKLMEAKHPDYKQRQAVEMSGSLKYEDKTDDDLRAELEELRKEVDSE